MGETSDQLTIGQVAERTGFSVHTLRYYEREGIVAGPVHRAAGGRRVYSEDDVGWLTVCSVLRGAGMPLAELRRYTALTRAGDGTEAERLNLLRAHEERIHAAADQLERCLDLIRFKISVYEDVLESDAGSRTTSVECGCSSTRHDPVTRASSSPRLATAAFPNTDLM